MDLRLRGKPCLVTGASRGIGRGAAKVLAIEGCRVAILARRANLLGKATHRTIEALNIQTSDGYAVSADVTLLYSIEDPVKIATDFGWGSLYVDAFVINTWTL